MLILCWASVAGVVAQSFVNPGFQSGTTGWSTCGIEIGQANVYGGPNTNMVAEVDGHNDPSTTTDDRLLCQTITGFTIGAVYALEFEATRRQTGPTPATVAVTVRIDGVLEQVVTRSGAWNMVREHFTFVPTSTTHSLRITPNFTGSHGMLFDNFNLVMVSPLPVELVGFNAWSVDEVVQLEWATATEHNNAGFHVQRSTDLVQWDEVTFVPGAGNHQGMISYSATDLQPLLGLAYYRLEQVDHDGTRDLSNVRPVLHKGRAGVDIWPNPAVSQVHIRSGEPGRMMVFDAYGRHVNVMQEDHNDGVLLHVTNLPTGQYLVRSLDEELRALKFIKE